MGAGTRACIESNFQTFRGPFRGVIGVMIKPHVRIVSLCFVNGHVGRESRRGIGGMPRRIGDPGQGPRRGADWIFPTRWTRPGDTQSVFYSSFCPSPCNPYPTTILHITTVTIATYCASHAGGGHGFGRKGVVPNRCVLPQRQWKRETAWVALHPYDGSIPQGQASSSGHGKWHGRPDRFWHGQVWFQTRRMRSISTLVVSHLTFHVDRSINTSPVMPKCLPPTALLPCCLTTVASDLRTACHATSSTLGNLNR